MSCFSCRTIINPRSGTAIQNELFFSTSYLRSGCFTTAVEKQWTILTHPQTGFLSGSLYVWVVSSLCVFFFFFLTNLRLVLVLWSHVFMLGPELPLRVSLESNHLFSVSLRSSEPKDDVELLIPLPASSTHCGYERKLPHRASHNVWMLSPRAFPDSGHSFLCAALLC